MCQKRFRTGLCALLAVASACSASGAWAQTSPAQSTEPTDTDSLAKVTVTARKLEEQLPEILEQQGIRVDTISAEAIGNGGYVDIAQALQSLAPGLSLSPKNGPFDYVNVSLQGSRTEDVLWLIDGVRINNRLYAGTTPLDTLPSSIVERVEILEGGQALFYGTEAAAGAINIVTKAFTDTADGAMSVGGDTNDSGHFDGFYRDAAGRSHFVFYADADVSAGFKPFRDQDLQPSSTDRDRRYHVYTAGAKYAYDFSEQLRFSALYQHTTAKLDFSLPFLVAEAFNQRDEDILSTKLDYSATENLQFFVKGYYHWWSSHYTEFDNTLGNPGVLTPVEDDGFWGFSDRGLNVMAKFRLGNSFDYSLGYDFQNFNGRDADLVITQKTESVNAIFAQIATSADLIDHTILAAGVRYNDPSVGQSATVWTFSGKHDFANGLFVRGLVGTAFRLPTAEELFANDPDDERGDPNLLPERSSNLNVSVGGSFGERHYKWELIGFARNITNLIDFGGFDPATDQALFANVPGTVRVRGAALDLAAEFTDFSADLNYTHSHSVQAGNLQIDSVPVQETKLSLDYHPQHLPFGLTASVIYVGAEYKSGLWDGRERYGDYPLVDLAGRCYLDSHRHHIISVRLENAFDRLYATSLGTAVRDSDGSDYTYWNLGVPRTLEARYTYKF